MGCNKANTCWAEQRWLLAVRTQVFWIPRLCWRLEWAWDKGKGHKIFNKMLACGQTWEWQAWWWHRALSPRAWIPIPAATIASFENLASYLTLVNLTFLPCKTGTAARLVFQSWAVVSWSPLWLPEAGKKCIVRILGSTGKRKFFANKLFFSRKKCWMKDKSETQWQDNCWASFGFWFKEIHYKKATGNL